MKRSSSNQVALATIAICAASVGLLVGSMMKLSFGMALDNVSPLQQAPASSARSVTTTNTCTTGSSTTTLGLVPDTCAKVYASPFDGVYKKGVWGSQMLTIQDFYSDGVWPPKERKSGSGHGSDLGYATETSLTLLRNAIHLYNVTTMIDLPCGDANWVFDSWELDSLELYIGLDIVKPVIDLNSKRLAHHSNKVFRHWDGAQCPLPKIASTTTPRGGLRSVDLIHSRDVLQHLTQKQGIQFLCNVFQSGAKVFLTTSFYGPILGGTAENKDITEGDFFLADLTAPPYDMPREESCTPTHPNIELDVTCTYNLTEPWVERWVAQKKCSAPY